MTAAIWEQWWFWLFVGPELVAAALFIVALPFILLYAFVTERTRR